MSLIESDAIEEHTWKTLYRLIKLPRQELTREIELLKNEWRRNVIDQFHQNPDLLKEKLDDCERAFSELSRAFEHVASTLEQKDIIDWVKRGREHLDVKEFKQALSCFQKALTKNPDSSLDLLILAGTAALHSREFSEAEIYAEQALGKNRDNVKAVMLKGLIHYSKKEFEIALQIFERALELKPDSASIKKYYKLAENYLKADPIQRDSKGFTSITNIVNPEERREWVRTDVDLEITLNNFEDMTSIVARAKSLSAGGCLLSPCDAPKEFHFNLYLGDEKRVHGYAERLYTTETGEHGIKFVTINPADQELINSRILSGLYGRPTRK